ncbi:MAG: aminoacyl-tRNA hydrolase [Aquiluna sp.]|uniref:aminoacyl-tRNA hydrolase n=1 Tax=Aquiluna sp. TaxID=2053504 RepID=UPI0027708C15|nr:aminoacyl-tRNA hydrolase [Aquiluna sp.]
MIVGLGNPGPNYQSNRHNIGQQVLDVLADKHSQRFKSHKTGTLVAEVPLSSQKLVLAKSQGFMNVSGSPVQKLLQFYSIPLDRLIVIHDELDIEFGELRKKFDGGHAGHNGLRDISAKCGTGYHRLRFGIGRPDGQMAVSDFVLQNFSTTERKELPVLIELAIDQVLEITTPKTT